MIAARKGDVADGRLGDFRSHGFTHMNRDAESNVFITVNLITSAFIKPNVLDKALVCIKSNTRPAQACRQSFRMCQQEPPQSLPLETWRDSEVLDEQVLAFIGSFDQRREQAVTGQQIEPVSLHRTLIICGHGLGLSPDHGNPFRIGLTREMTNRGYVGPFCLSQFNGHVPPL